jgi:hypothetical protein
VRKGRAPDLNTQDDVRKRRVESIIVEGSVGWQGRWAYVSARRREGEVVVSCYVLQLPR